MKPWRWRAVAAGLEQAAGRRREDNRQGHPGHRGAVARRVAYASGEGSPRRERPC